MNARLGKSYVDFSDFESKDAYIEGAKAAQSGLALKENPYSTFEKRSIWASGHQTATDGRFRSNVHLSH
jgi:ribosome modulation factor